MTTTAEKIKVMQAFDEWKQKGFDQSAAIEKSKVDVHPRKWEDVGYEPQWNWEEFVYRIKPPDPEPPKGFQSELESLINWYSIEGDSNTPDYILAEYLCRCLEAFSSAIQARKNIADVQSYNRPTDFEPEVRTMTTAEKIEMMQAFEDGAQIQYAYEGKWEDCTDTPTWSWATTVYRVKPAEPEPDEIIDKAMESE